MSQIKKQILNKLTKIAATSKASTVWFVEYNNVRLSFGNKSSWVNIAAAKCAFQYATRSSIFKDIEIVHDQSELTLDEAKKLWSDYYPDLKNHIKNGNSGEMAIWINMEDPYSYKDKLYHISNDAEVEGDYIVETTKNYFPKIL